MFLVSDSLKPKGIKSQNSSLISVRSSPKTQEKQSLLRIERGRGRNVTGNKEGKWESVPLVQIFKKICSSQIAKRLCRGRPFHHTNRKHIRENEILNERICLDKEVLPFESSCGHWAPRCSLRTPPPPRAAEGFEWPRAVRDWDASDLSVHLDRTPVWKGLKYTHTQTQKTWLNAELKGDTSEKELCASV